MMATAHAEAAHDGPAKAWVLIQEAAVFGVPARWTGLPQPQEAELAAGALWAAGASTGTSGLRAAARWQLAWERAATGDEHGALQEAECAAVDAQRAGWDPYSLQIEYGQVLARSGHHAVAQQH
jgi:hypothetical protein